MIDINIKILQVALKNMTEVLDNLLEECIEDNGDIKKPSKQIVMKSRAYLPSTYKNGYKKKRT